jgi:N-methylhydantoinase A
MFTVAIDVGGTFTDVVIFDKKSQKIAMGKSLTTPLNLQTGVINGLENACEKFDIDIKSLLSKTERIIHATTQSTNAVFEFKGAKTAVLTTQGFEDTLIIMRASGRVAGLSVFERHHYRNTQKPRLLANEKDIFSISERIDYKGEIVLELDESQVINIVEKIANLGYESISIAYLFSHKNPVHELRTASIIKKIAPNIYVSVSSSIAPVIGEYERSATALFNGYVGPVIESYLKGLEKTLKGLGLKEQLLIVQSNGGLTTAKQVTPIYTIESGPAAGVVGAAHLSSELDSGDVIATDVGGTTFKVAIVKNGRWTYTKETILNQYQLRLPMVDVSSIGAGGGSIAWLDNDRLRVGPQSASSSPGPACYGLGGTEPTVTDADVVLGYISPAKFLAGKMQLNHSAAFHAIKTKIADPLFEGDTLRAAAGIRRVIDSQMADLIRKSTLERGHDPRNFVMMAYGGSGPTHAASYAAEVGCKKIIIPYFATVHSAYGAAISDIRFSLSFSDPLILPVDFRKLEKIYLAMENQGHEKLAEAGVSKSKRRFERWVEARYRRQVHNVRIPVDSKFNKASIAKLIDDFNKEYERLFGVGSGLRDAGVECINFGVEAIGLINKPIAELASKSRAKIKAESRMAYCLKNQKMVRHLIYDGPSLPSNFELSGPALIEHPGTTIVISANQFAKIDKYKHTHIHIK